MQSNRRFSWIIGWLLAFSLCIMVLTATGSAQAVFSSPGSTMAVLLITLVLGELIGYGTARPPKAADARLSAMRERMAEFFRTIVIESPQDERLAFEGRTATVVEDDEMLGIDDQGQHAYSVKRYARNPSGEYFWLILQVINETPTIVFAKHVEHNVARYVLKDKYVAPPADGF